MLCTGMEEFLISDWSSPFGKFTELGMSGTVLLVLLNATAHKKTEVHWFHVRIRVNGHQVRQYHYFWHSKAN